MKNQRGRKTSQTRKETTMNKSTKSLGYRINYREGTISVSDRLIQEANREGVNSTAHNTLKALREMGMPIVKFRENTTHRKGLTYSKMTKYILMCENSEKYMCEFIRQREVSKSQTNGYHYVLKWFHNTFPNYNEQAEFNEKGEIIITSADYLTETEEQSA